jgi:orotidine-5'-phosphate decarboxylase
MNTFGVRLRRALDRWGPLCVGVDPHADLLARWGLPDTPQGLDRFCRTVVEALADRVAVIKPQSAFFERYGSAGIAVLESTIRQSRAAGALVLCDVKRGDIGSTVQAYAQAYLGPGRPLQCDAITASPYQGFGSLDPLIDEAEAHAGGVFVVAVTSNPEAAQVQDSRTSDGRSVAQSVIDQAAARNRDRVATGERDPAAMGSVGVVFGVNMTGPKPDLRQLRGPILAPGLGAQGGRPEDLIALFRDVRAWVVPSYSREILAHGPSVTGLRQAAVRALEQCRKVLNYSDL